MSTTSLARERERFVARIVWEYLRANEGTEQGLQCHMVLDKAQEILYAGGVFGRLQETACNRELTEHEQRKELRMRERILEALEALGFSSGACFGGDPRGATVKLRLPSGYTDDWGETGFCVPTS